MNSSSDLPFNYIDRADAVTVTTINTGFFVDHMNVTLLADCIYRTDFSTCSTVNTTFINSVSSYEHPPLVVRTSLKIIRDFASCNVSN